MIEMEEMGQIIESEEIDRTKSIWEQTELKKIKGSELEDSNDFKKIGYGACANVYSSIYKCTNVALKKLGYCKSIALCNEILIHENFYHLNVVGLFGLHNSVIFKDVMLVMERCDADLRQLLFRNPMSPIPFFEKLCICAGIANGMDHISSYGVFHNDLAARNILIKTRESSQYGEGKYTAKISDFGLSCICTGEYFISKRSQGPIKWYGPEVLELDDCFTYYKSSDVWSFGVLLWEIFAVDNLLPYSVMDCKPNIRTCIRNNSVKLEMPENCPLEIVAIANECLNINHLERPSFIHLAKKFEKLIAKELEEGELPWH